MQTKKEKNNRGRRGKRRPSYSHKLVQAARLIWFDERNDITTRNKLEKKFPDEAKGISRQTIQKWRIDYGWEAWAADIDMQMDKRINEKIVDRRMLLISDVATLTDKIKVAVMNCKKPFRSTREAIATFKDCLQMERDMRGWDKLPLQINVEKIVNQLFLVLAADPKVGPIIAERQEILLQDLQKQLEGGNGKTLSASVRES